MHNHPLQLKAYKSKPPWVLGTFALGREHFSAVRDRHSMQLLQNAWQSGIRHFDTALVYGKGHAERLLARLMKGQREHAWIASKTHPTGHSYPQVIAACEQSLKNLNTDYIDLYQIHWPCELTGSTHIPLTETLDALAQLQQQGKIRKIGVCNFNLKQLQHAGQHVEISAIQCSHSLLWRRIDTELLEYCHLQDIIPLAYSPLAQGLLCSNFSREHFSAHDIRQRHYLHQGKLQPAVTAIRQQLQIIADRYQCDISHLAIAWLEAQNIVPIIGMRLARHLHQHLEIGEIKISSADVQKCQDLCQDIQDYYSHLKVQWVHHDA